MSRPIDTPTFATLPDRFVDLDRRFIAVDKEKPREEIADESYADVANFWGGKGWDELHKKRLVVVQGELGSGKTWELRHQHQQLAAAGQAAFLIALEQLALTSWEQAVGEAALPQFLQWKKGMAPGIFFLDSVDESKLRRNSDFRLAIKRCAEALGVDGLGRARFIISSRITEWHPETDGAEVSTLLAKPIPEPAEDEDDEQGGDDDDAPAKAEALELVQILPLNRERVAKMARSLGIAKVDDFLSELDRTFSWDFARRPLDVVELANYWKKQGRIGSLTELMEYSITTNLEESPDRRKEDILTPQLARTGAEALAAAAVFSRQLTFRIADGVIVSDSLDPQQVLPTTWQPNMVQALLGRPLFDGASFGRIRFHHRRTMEYLAACWVRKCLAVHCDLDVLKRLLLADVGSRQILRRSRTSIAAWLCVGTEPWCDRVREWVLEANPSIHWRFGDPSALSAAYKRAIFSAMRIRAKERDWLWLHAHPGASSRLYEPSLDKEIVSIIGDTTAAGDLRMEMLRMARYAGAGPIVDAAFLVLEAPSESRSLKAVASSSLAKLSDPAVKNRLANYPRVAEKIPEAVATHLLQGLFSETADADLLAIIVEKTDRAGGEGGMKHALTELAEELKPAECVTVLKHLVRLAQLPPHRADTEYVPLSKAFKWLRRPLLPLCEKLLQLPVLAPEEVGIVVTALFLIETKDEDLSSSKDRRQRLHGLSLAHPAVRQAYFWLLARREEQRKEEPIRHMALFWRHYRGLSDHSSDFPWLLGDITARSSEWDRLTAVRNAQLAWQAGGSPRAGWKQLKEATAADPVLRVELLACRAHNKRLPWIRWTSRIQHFRVMAPSQVRFWWQRQVHAYRVWRAEWRLRGKLPHLESGEDWRWLHDLCRETKSRDYSVVSFRKVEKKRGRRVARAARLGCQQFWRRYTPPAPHEQLGTSPGTVIGLAGLNADFQDGKLRFSVMSDAEVAQLVHYAFAELNNVPDWFSALAAERPASVMQALEPSLMVAWSTDQPPNGISEVLRKVVYLPEVPACISTRIEELLATSEPKSGGTLIYALMTLLKRKPLPRTALAKFAADRLAARTVPTLDSSAWFAIWLQTDASACLPVLEDTLRQQTDPNLMVRIMALLNGRSMGQLPLVSPADFLTPASLAKLIPLTYEFVHPADDIDRRGSTSPGDRDFAQEARDSLAHRLIGLAPESATVLAQLAELPILSNIRAALLHYLDDHLDLYSEAPAWTEGDVRDFAETHETAAKTPDDLFHIVRRRLHSFKHAVEGGDNSPRAEFRDGDREEVLRQAIARHLERTRASHYAVVQEAEIDRKERPDLRIEHPSLPAVPIEVKRSQETLATLLERLENQLVGQYFRDEKIIHGFFFVGRSGTKKHWESPDGNLTFGQVIVALEKRARELAAAHTRSIIIEVVAVDFRPLS